MEEAKYKEVLKIIYSRLKDSDINWAVFGSANLLLHGLPAEPSDIDILTNEEGAYKIESLLSEYIFKKVEFSSNGKIQSHFGKLNINGIKVEIIGDFRSSIDKNLKPIVKLNSGAVEFLKIDDAKIPFLTLERELVSYTNLDRPDKVKLIKEYKLINK